MTPFKVEFWHEFEVVDEVIVDAAVNDEHAIEQARELACVPDDADAFARPLPSMVAA